jgi:outer membrane protein assembly factor BamE
VELVAEIDGYAKSKRSFWDIVTGSNKPPVTPPLQQPELLVPSPTNNMPAGAAVSTGIAIPAVAVPATKQLGPGALNVPQAGETK